MKQIMIKYLGETGKSSYERVFQHFYAFKQKKEPNIVKKIPGSVLWQHSKEIHNGSMKIGDWLPKVNSLHRGPLNRQVTEGVRKNQNLVQTI